MTAAGCGKTRVIAVAGATPGIENNGVGEESQPTGTVQADPGHAPDPGTPGRRPTAGYRRLIRWAGGRAAWVAVGLVVGLTMLRAAGSDAATFRTLTGSAVATVIGSQVVDTGSGSDSQSQLVVTVRFTPLRAAAQVQTTVEPNNLGSVRLGQHLPVRYDPADAAIAAYNGPGGDAVYSNGQAERVFAITVLVLDAILAFTGAARLTRILRAAYAAAGIETSAADMVVRTSDSAVRLLRIRGPGDGTQLEWRVLARQPQSNGTVSLRGRLGRGGWLVAALPDARLIWPSSSAQSVLGIGPPDIALDDSVGLSAVAAQRRLLAGYALLLGMVEELPPLISRPPGGKAQAQWWWFGAPRPVVRLLAAAHVRHRLRALAAAQLRAAVLSPPADGDAARRLLYEASRECAAFADTLPRRAWLTLAVSVVTTGLAIYSPFFPTPRLHVALSLSALRALLIILFSLGLAVIPLFVFFHSVRCKRALFNPAATAGYQAGPGAGWNVYRYEEKAFEGAGAVLPREWEAMPRLRWIVGVIYAGTIGGILLLTQGWLAVAIPGVIMLLLLWRMRVVAARRNR